MIIFWKRNRKQSINAVHDGCFGFQKGSKTPIIGMFDAYRIKLVNALLRTSPPEKQLYWTYFEEVTRKKWPRDILMTSGAALDIGRSMKSQFWLESLPWRLSSRIWWYFMDRPMSKAVLEVIKMSRGPIFSGNFLKIRPVMMFFGWGRPGQCVKAGAHLFENLDISGNPGFSIENQ